jgi:hypothetical protein
MKDDTPDFVPAWINSLTCEDWHRLIGGNFGAARVIDRVLDASAQWRLHGRRSDFKVKVELLLEGAVPRVWLVMKGSQSPREAVFYRATQCLESEVLPRIYHTWIDDAPDGLHWVLMVYHAPVSGSEIVPEKVVQSQAHIHASCMGREDLLKQMPWEEASLYPFMSESVLRSSVSLIPELLGQVSIDVESSLSRRLDRFVHGASSPVKEIYQQPRTVTHCDLHPGNFLVTNADGAGIIIDWAPVCVNVPFFDVWRTLDYFAEQRKSDPRVLCRSYMQWAREQSDHFPAYSLNEFFRFLLTACAVSHTIRLERLLTHLYRKGVHNWDTRLPQWNTSHDLRELICREARSIQTRLDALERGSLDP